MAERIAELGANHQKELDAITGEAWLQQSAEQDECLAAEEKLALQDQQHTKELSDAQRNQARLLDQLATADVRLSVLLAEDPTSSCNVPTTPAPAAWFMQPVEPNLTQRILNELSASPTTGITP